MRTFIRQTAIITAILICSHQPALAADQPSGKESSPLTAAYFPFVPGWQWQYSYLSEEQNSKGKDTAPMFGATNGATVKVDRVKGILTIEVLFVLEDKNDILAHVRGNRLNSDNNPESQSDYVMRIHKPSGAFCTDQPISKVQEFLEGKLEPPKGFEFLLPIQKDQHWDFAVDSHRKDHMYEWHVEGEDTIKVPAGTFKCMRLAFRTCPDHSIIWYAPKIGIIKKEYMHHGTIFNSFIELKSYGIKK